VKRVKTDPVTPLAHVATLNKVVLARYNMTRVELKTFTFSDGSKSLSIHNAHLGPVPKRLLFSMIKNADFIGTVDTNSYKFQHYLIGDFSLFVNGKQYPNEGYLWAWIMKRPLEWVIGLCSKGQASISRTLTII